MYLTLRSTMLKSILLYYQLVYQNPAAISKAERESQRNQGLVKGEPDTFLNLSTQSKLAMPKNIMMDSIRINLDCARTAVSRNTKG